MSEIILTEKSRAPDASILKTVLGTVYPYLLKLEAITKNFSQEWKYYNKKSGWIYKVSDKKKALFYITPLKDSFNIGFALRETEKDSLLNNEISNEIREKLNSALKYPEGFALRLNIKNGDEYNNLVFILNIIIKSRK